MKTPESRRRGRVIGAGLLGGLALAGCVDLPLIEEDECGNRVIEAGEECDGDETGCAQPGTQHECRYLCAPLLDGVDCPAAYGCGLDGVCRRPSGAFEATVASSTVTTSGMLVGDLDADGCAEMVRAVSRGTILVTSFASRSPGLCSASEQGLVAYRPGVGLPPRPAPLLFDLTTAGTSPAGPPGEPPPGEPPPGEPQPGEEEETPATLEIVAPGDGPLGSGLLVYFADTPPALPSLIHPSLRLPDPDLRALSVRAGDTDALLLLLGGPQGSTQVAVVDDPLLPPAPLGTIPIPLAEIGAVSAADLDGGSPGCDEVALARRDASSIQLYRLCDAAGAKAWAPLPNPEVMLDDGVAIHAENPSIALVDYNDDGYLDVVTHTAVNSIHIAYGLGDGRFHSSEPFQGVVPDQRTSELVAPIPQAGATSRKLVAGNFDATPGADFNLINCPPASEDFGSPVCARIPGECEAVVADVDADSYDDVVIAENQQPDLIVLRGGPEGLAPPLYLATQCPPHHVTAGDVDADGVPDIAFFDQVAPSVGNPVTALSVAFGNAFAAPAAPEVLGRLELAYALVGGRFTEDASGDQLFAARLDGVQLGEMPGPGTRTALALVEGLTERLVRAPFYFPAPEGDPASVASVELRATTAGFFTLDADGAPRPGLAAVTGDLAVWRVENDEFPGVLVGAEAGALNPPDAAQELQCDRCVLAAVDVDADRRDDLLFIDDRHVAVLASSQDGFVRRDCEDAAFSYRASVWSNPPEYAPRPLVADLDGDGRQDVVLRAETGALIALWGRADGCFDEIPLVSAQGCEPGASCGDMSIAWVDADPGDAEKELVVAGPRQLEIFVVRRGTRALESKGIVEGTAPPPPDTDFTAVGAADVDGDGVQDIVLMPTSNFVRILRGVPELE